MLVCRKILGVFVSSCITYHHYLWMLITFTNAARFISQRYNMITLNCILYILYYFSYTRRNIATSQGMLVRYFPILIYNISMPWVFTSILYFQVFTLGSKDMVIPCRVLLFCGCAIAAALANDFHQCIDNCKTFGNCILSDCNAYLQDGSAEKYNLENPSERFFRTNRGRNAFIRIGKSSDFSARLRSSRLSMLKLLQMLPGFNLDTNLDGLPPNDVYQKGNNPAGVINVRRGHTFLRIGRRDILNHDERK